MELYGTPHGDYPDNAERFSFFNRAALEAIKVLSFQPDIIHSHDWQSALIPIYLKTLYQSDPFFQQTQTLLTIHNLGYQELFPSTQLSILGTGDEHYQKRLLQISLTYPEKTCVLIGSNITLARQVYAGSDFFLMPSLYESCGIGQLISLRYGTIPIVRKTGGLADTVEEFNPITGKGRGFLFQEYSPKGLLGVMDQALTCYQNPHHRNKMISNAMKLDFSWRVSTERYSELYGELSQKNKRDQDAHPLINNMP